MISVFFVGELISAEEEEKEKVVVVVSPALAQFSAAFFVVHEQTFYASIKGRPFVMGCVIVRVCLMTSPPSSFPPLSL